MVVWGDAASFDKLDPRSRGVAGADADEEEIVVLVFRCLLTLMLEILNEELNEGEEDGTEFSPRSSAWSGPKNCPLLGENLGDDLSERLSLEVLGKEQHQERAEFLLPVRKKSRWR